MNNYCIYIHINKINQKVYIGQTCQKPEYRWNNGEGYKGSPRFYSAIQSYGWDNFEHIVLYTQLSLKQANAIETKLIQQYNSTDSNFGYNLDSGGKNKGTNIETRIKQSVSAQNRPIVSQQTKEKLSQNGKGKVRNEITKQKISESAKQRERERKGKKKIPVLCINTGMIFPSCREAADWCGLVGVSGISSVCKQGKQKTAGVHPETQEKLKWRYLTPEEEKLINNS